MLRWWKAAPGPWRQAEQPCLALLPLRAHKSSDGRSWDGTSWDGRSWDGTSWDGTSWDGRSAAHAWDDRSAAHTSWDGTSAAHTSWDGTSAAHAWDGRSAAHAWDGTSWDDKSEERTSPVHTCRRREPPSRRGPYLGPPPDFQRPTGRYPAPREIPRCHKHTCVSFEKPPAYRYRSVKGFALVPSLFYRSATLTAFGRGDLFANSAATIHRTPCCPVEALRPESCGGKCTA